MFDTQIAAGFLGISSASLVSLVERLLGRRLEKGDQLTDWTRRPLNESQLRYAAGDVAHLLDLYAELHRRLEEKGRLEWAEAECALALERSRTPVVPEEAWWRLRQARQLRGRDRGVAQEVAAWRERKAQELDQPTRFLISDLALASIAHRPPASRSELGQVRSMEPRHLAGGGADEILAAVARGLTLGNAELHLPPGPSGGDVAKPAVTLVAAWVSERAKELEIDQAILATRADLVAFLQEPPAERLQESWRNALVGEPIRRLVAGDVALALDGAALVLEERSRRRYVGPGDSATPSANEARS
jgi:ribonuclease D